ncbi:MAG: DUF1269 domain-containing protein [Deltaproteobacteria bacterium]|nr:DUF1269 domain-containing protein [Candidatus Tharpella aukensis]
MSNLVAVVFKDETTAFEMRAALAKMQKEYLIEMEDAVVVTKDDKGKVKLHQAVNLTLAGAGALSGKLTDISISDQMMKDLAASFEPGSSALFVLIRKATTDKVLEGLQAFDGKGKVFKTSLTQNAEKLLRDALEHA